jgi:hypothetical protein
MHPVVCLSLYMYVFGIPVKHNNQQNKYFINFCHRDVPISAGVHELCGSHRGGRQRTEIGTRKN